MEMKYVPLFLVFILMISWAGYAQNSNTVCLNSTTAQENISITVTGSTTSQLTITQNEDCQFGCDDSPGGSNQCIPDPTNPNLFVFLPAFVIFFLAYLMVYIATNIQEGRELQFLFFGFAMFFMVALAWYGETTAYSVLNRGLGSVMSSLFLAVIVIMMIVLFYMILKILLTAWKNTKMKKYGTS